MKLGRRWGEDTTGNWRDVVRNAYDPHALCKYIKLLKNKNII